MLAAIIANLQNEAPRREILQFDHGGGGAIGPRYEIVDYAFAAQMFQEIPGEHPVMRSARRQRHIADLLPLIKRARENREAAAFLAGAGLAERAAADKAATERTEIRDELAGVLAAHLEHVKGQIEAATTERGARGGGLGFLCIGVAVGLGVGLAAGARIGRRRGR
jgi:hypothetical protein